MKYRYFVFILLVSIGLYGKMNYFLGMEECENSIGMKFVRVKQGSFMIGQNNGGDWDERHLHKVNITN